jgi:hypothetical protein
MTESPARPIAVGTRRRDTEIYHLTVDEQALALYWGPEINKHLSEASRAKAVNNIENDPKAQSDAKVGEIVMARILGLAIWRLHWVVNRGPDNGWDLKFDRDTLNAKTSSASSVEYLTVSRSHVVDGKLPPGDIKADKLVLVQVGPRGAATWGLCRGWTLRARFYELYGVAGPNNNKRLDPSTPYVWVRMLYDMSELRSSYQVRHFDPDLELEVRQKREFEAFAREAGLDDAAIAKFLEET